MTQEEKAKAYDEAIKRASNIHKDAVEMENNMITKTCEVIFPELAESEDEKIRKALMQNLKERFGTKGNMGEGLDMPDVLAWLEKQGEQKPINHFELKAGHWYICHHPYCCRAGHLTVKEGERFMCEKDGVAKGYRQYKEKQWKPSDEQMERLKGTINSLPHQKVLYSLYQDLLKLKG